MTQRQQEVRDLISAVLGFRAYYATRTSGGAVSVTVCDSTEGTDESVRVAADWIRTSMSGASISPPEISEGEAYISF